MLASTSADCAALLLYSGQERSQWPIGDDGVGAADALLHAAIWSPHKPAHAFLSTRWPHIAVQMLNRSPRSLPAGCPCLRGLRLGICPKKRRLPTQCLAADGEPATIRRSLSMVPENRMERPAFQAGVVLEVLLFLLAWFVLQELGVI